MGRHSPKSLKGAGRIDPDELQVLANVPMPGAAGGAITAGVQRTRGNAIAGPVAIHGRSDRRDSAGHLVPHHVRQMETIRHGAVKQVEVGPADPQ